MISSASPDPLAVGAGSSEAGCGCGSGQAGATPARVAAARQKTWANTVGKRYRALAAPGPGTMVGLWVLILLVLLCALAPVIAPHDPTTMELSAKLQGPSVTYPLGTDGLGRCVFSRLLYGGRVSMGISFLVVLATAVLGSVVGLASGMSTRIIDQAIMGFTDIVLAFPPIILVLVIAGLLKPSLSNLALALIVVGWSPFARLARIQAMVIRRKEYVEAAICAGASTTRLAFRHVLPNILGPITALAFLRLGNALLSLAGLSFLGLGAQPPTPEWGVMLSEARRYMSQNPLVMLAPGVSIFLATLSVSVSGEGLRMILDPRQRRS